MTLYAWAARRRFPALPPPEARYFQVTDRHAGARPLPLAGGSPRGALTVILLHGLEGSSDSHYMRGMAEKAWRRGFNVVRLNQRNCGGTEHLTPGLYHSGLTADPLAVMRLLRDHDGLSALRLLRLFARRQHRAEAGRRAGRLRRRRARRRGHGGVAADRTRRTASTRSNAAPTSPTTWNFLWGLRGRMRRKAALFPTLYDTRPLGACAVGARLRRSLHRAAQRLCRRRRLLPSRQRAARDRSAWRCRRCSSRPMTIRSCRRRRRATPRSTPSPHLTRVVTRTRRTLRLHRTGHRRRRRLLGGTPRHRLRGRRDRDADRRAQPCASSSSMR